MKEEILQLFSKLQKILEERKEKKINTSFIPEKPWKYSTQEDIRWLLWLTLIRECISKKYNCHIYIRPEAYVQGINFNVQILFYDPKDTFNCWNDLSTGMWGDNGEFPENIKALEFGIKISLQLIINQYEK